MHLEVTDRWEEKTVLAPKPMSAVTPTAAIALHGGLFPSASSSADATLYSPGRSLVS